MKADIKVDRARVGDASSLHRLISHFADKGEVLPRALSEIYDGIRDYFVVRRRGRVIACAALHVTWVDLAEIRSLAVDEKEQNQKDWLCAGPRPVWKRPGSWAYPGFFASFASRLSLKSMASG